MTKIPSPAGHLFCFGLGYSALRVARRLAAAGWQVAGTCRTDAARPALAAEGFAVHVFDGSRPMADAKAVLVTATHVLVSAPPGPDGDSVLAHHAADLAAAPALRWVGYFSTTGVYGDTGGAWVDEDTPPAPRSARARARVAAEAAWQGWATAAGIALDRFRLAGIYGPGRSPFDALREGRARRVVKPGQVFSRIHVDDIVTAVVAAIGHRLERPGDASPEGSVYNLCDDEPASQAAVVAHAAKLLNMAPPPEIAWDSPALSPMARSFHAECRRVSNARVKRALGVTLAYRDYRAGLAAILESGG